MEDYVSNHQFITNTVQMLFEHERKFFKQRTQVTIKKFSEMVPDADGFYFMDQFFHNVELKGVGTNKTKKAQLPAELVPEMKDAVTAFAKFNEDRYRIMQALALALVLDSREEKQVIRDSLPECLVDFLPDLKKLERQNEEAYLIKNNPQKYEQYMKIRPMIKFYTATKYIY